MPAGDMGGEIKLKTTLFFGQNNSKELETVRSNVPQHLLPFLFTTPLTFSVVYNSHVIF